MLVRDIENPAIKFIKALDKTPQIHYNLFVDFYRKLECKFFINCTFKCKKSVLIVVFKFFI